jgi:hypothetical protein
MTVHSSFTQNSRSAYCVSGFRADDAAAGRLPLVITRDFLFAQSEKPGGIVVENVSLLFPAYEVGRINHVDATLDGSGPVHLIRPEHNALPESCFDDPPVRAEISRKIRPVLLWMQAVQEGLP